jgi:type II secretory pathway pseudopilin PulG
MVELLVVIGLIAILSAVGFLSVVNYQSLVRVNASARDLAGHLRTARARAVRDGQAVTVQFLSPNSYRITDPAMHVQTYFFQPGIVYGVQNSGGANCSLGHLPAVPDHNYPPPATGIEISGGGTSFNFTPDGTASATGVVYMLPTGDNVGSGCRADRNRAVDWEAMTGRVRAWKQPNKNTAPVWK